MSTIAQDATPGVVVGVDTHLDSHTAVALDDLGRKLGQVMVSADGGGYRQLISWSAGLGDLRCFGVEGTGSYGAGVARYLAGRGHRVIEVCRPNRQDRRRLGKSDPVDAELAARQVLSGTVTVQPKRQDGWVEMLRALRVARAGAVSSSTQAINALKALLVTAPDVLRTRLRGLTTGHLVSTCASFRPGCCDNPLAATKLALRSLARRILALKAEAAALKAELERLTAREAPELLDLFAVGPEIASAVLVTVGDNFERLPNEAAFASLCGVSPIPASSGKTNRHRLNRGGNRQANAALHRTVLVRLRYHRATQAYLARRTAEGKSKREIIRCLKRDVAWVMFGALKAMQNRRTARPDGAL